MVKGPQQVVEIEKRTRSENTKPYKLIDMYDLIRVVALRISNT